VLDKLLLDDEDFRVTVGLLGGISVMVKHRQLTVKALKEERAYLLDILGHLERSGTAITPTSEITKEVIRDFADAVAGRGGWTWQLFFTQSPAQLKADEYRL
jgi:hypothetical protein